MILLLMIIWIILNGRWDTDVLITGGAAALALFIAVCLLGGWSIRKELRAYMLIPQGVMYFFNLIKEIFLANIATIKVIFKKDNQPCIRTIKTGLKTPAARTMLANSITLTPGTVTIQMNEDVLTVHCLSQEMAEGLADFSPEKRLMKMEGNKC